MGVGWKCCWEEPRGDGEVTQGDREEGGDWGWMLLLLLVEEGKVRYRLCSLCRRKEMETRTDVMT